ncbi:type II toxin-antitoxin system VapC family toxin [Methylovulum miyakonense]|uniref:type II toxin-antitoxin system VapC family toxin n=1 Tax=Methylovulum miyakonense TaxID=645578 RepID=UPI00036ABF70|nr:type II toxin-antitoxin system VapC family toxin [Methylovulum miyakonense]
MTKQVLCDTCILIDFVNGRSRQLVDLHSQNIQLFINPVIELELLQGARNKVEMQKLEKIVAMFHHLEMPPEVFNVARQLIKQYSLSHGLRLADALIASTALVYGLELLTINQKDFRFIPELVLCA